MAKIQRMVPFKLMPASWGLKGESYKIAEAEYYYTDHDLAVQLAYIKHPAGSLELEHALVEADLKWGKKDQSEYEIAKAVIDGDKVSELTLKFKYGKISEKEHDYGIAELRNDEGTWLGVKHKHGELSDNDFCKQMSTLRGEPWVNMVKMDISGGVNTGSFELDWNDKFIETIRAEGFVGRTDEDCVDLWLTSIAKNIALAELSGTGIFDEQAEESYQLKKTRLAGGKTEYK